MTTVFKSYSFRVAPNSVGIRFFGHVSSLLEEHKALCVLAFRNLPASETECRWLACAVEANRQPIYFQHRFS
ncbi:hypothetical protein CC2G_015167 [Coprinopsis cinerea AmutBmut pab1-1]|nr:hypothetical protein CC2G_015167 [Coprinopsis cinerea AmutBmut pab1-1]